MMLPLGRTRHPFVILVHALLCVAGLALAVYAAFAWIQATFSSGTYTTATDPIMRPQDGRLFTFGLILFGYSLFAVARLFQQSRLDDTTKDATKDI